jgi:hypothetical protein
LASGRTGAPQYGQRREAIAASSSSRLQTMQLVMKSSAVQCGEMASRKDAKVQSIIC